MFDLLPGSLYPPHGRTEGRSGNKAGAREFQYDPNWRDDLPFYEYFHGDNGAGIGAGHQTGLVARIVQFLGYITPEQVLGEKAPRLTYFSSPAGRGACCRITDVPARRMRAVLRRTGPGG